MSVESDCCTEQIFVSHDQQPPTSAQPFSTLHAPIWYMQNSCIHLHFSFHSLPYKFHCVCFGTLIRLVAGYQHRYALLAHCWVCQYLQQLPAEPHGFIKSQCSSQSGVADKSSVTGCLLSNGCLLSHKIHRVDYKNNAPCIVNIALNSAAYFGVSWHIHKVDWPILLCLLSRQTSEIIIEVFLF